MNRTLAQIAVGLLLAQITIVVILWLGISGLQSDAAKLYVAMERATRATPPTRATPRTVEESLIGTWVNTYEYADTGNVVLTRTLVIDASGGWRMTAQLAGEDRNVSTHGLSVVVGGRIAFLPGLAISQANEPESHTHWKVVGCEDAILRVRELRIGTQASSWGDEESWYRSH